MRKPLDTNKIVKGLRAERRGTVRSNGGYFGALGLLADVEARFRDGGGRATDPHSTERRLVALARETLQKLAALAAEVRRHGGVQIEPMQLAAPLLERTTEQLNEADGEELLGRKRAGHAGRSSKRLTTQPKPVPRRAQAPMRHAAHGRHG